MRGLLLLVAVLALLPAAQAQGLGAPYTLRFEDVPTSEIKPQVETPAFQAVVEARCDFVLSGVSPSSPADPVPLVDVLFQFQSGVVVTGAGTILADPMACASAEGTTITVRQPYQVSIPRTAPGLQAIPGVAKHSPAARGVPTGAVEQPLPLTVTADYDSVNQVKVSSKLKQCESACGFEIEVANLGNARTQYTFEVVGRPHDDSWKATLPPTLLLDSPNSGLGDSTAVVVVKVTTPTGAGGEGAFELKITPSAADDPTKVGNPMTVNFMVRDRGVLGVPGPAGPLIGLGLLAAALVARRRA